MHAWYSCIMLIRFSVKNFRSIRDEVALDLTPKRFISDSTDNSFPTGVNEVPQLHRIASIYGVNGSGKTNILRGADLLRELLLFSAKKNTEGDEIPVQPFRLDGSSRNQPTEFSIEFIAAGIRYVYNLAATSKRVISETLYAFPNGIRQLWYDRYYNDSSNNYEWKFGPNFRGEKSDTKQKTLENVLFFSKAVMDNHEQLKPINEYFRQKFYINPNNGMEDDVVHELMQSNEGKQLVMSLLKAADLDIDDVILKSRELSLDSIPKEFREKFKDAPVYYQAYSVHHVPETGEVVTFDFEDEESMGTNKFFHLAGIIIKALVSGSVLMIDELETSLHCKLMDFILDIFNSSSRNMNGSQLIFTTHAPIALDHEALGRDQIWFTDKTASKNTILYSLAELSKFRPGEKPLRKDQKISKGYLEGRFYAPPKHNVEQFNLFSDEVDKIEKKY